MGKSIADITPGDIISFPDFDMNYEVVAIEPSTEVPGKFNVSLREWDEFSMGTEETFLDGDEEVTVEGRRPGVKSE